MFCVKLKRLNYSMFWFLPTVLDLWSFFIVILLMQFKHTIIVNSLEVEKFESPWYQSKLLLLLLSATGSSCYRSFSRHTRLSVAHDHLPNLSFVHIMKASLLCQNCCLPVNNSIQQQMRTEIRSDVSTLEDMHFRNAFDIKSYVMCTILNGTLCICGACERFPQNVTKGTAYIAL